jgi:hypothetical protein
LSSASSFDAGCGFFRRKFLKTALINPAYRGKRSIRAASTVIDTAA